jgi:hypothetical protein
MKQLVSAMAVWIILTLSTSAQPFSIDWSTIDGGGGGGSAGAYSLTGTIGQPDAGATMANAPYAVQGGFWSVLGTRPELRVWLEDGNVVLAWPATASDCLLQQTDSLGDTSNLGIPLWSNISQVPSAVGGELQVTQPLSPLPRSKLYYRLIKP